MGRSAIGGSALVVERKGEVVAAKVSVQGCFTKDRMGSCFLSF